jgi:enoyl-CoA hydratase/carnithine racemase
MILQAPSVGLSRCLGRKGLRLTDFDTYCDRYSCVRMERSDGILQITLHSDGDTLQWGPVPSRELPEAFNDIARDTGNKVIILTGAGEGFSGPLASPRSWPSKTPSEWDQTIRNEMRMGLGMLDIEVPMIAAVNGPALRHSELALLCDIVLASESATFMDSGHFAIGAVPGDPVHVIYPLLMGLNRGRYFLLTGETLDAERGLSYGLVNEILSRDRLLPRAWELARDLSTRSLLALRYTRILLTHRLKRDIHETLGYGMALAGLTQGEKERH